MVDGIVEADGCGLMGYIYIVSRPVTPGKHGRRDRSEAMREKLSATFGVPGFSEEKRRASSLSHTLCLESDIDGKVVYA
jgi:hypothetical protein